MSDQSTAASVQPSRFEPTVIGAMRRYRIMVLAIVVGVTAAAIGYSLMQPKTYSAKASLTAPPPASQQGQVDPGQYLDSQVLLLQSQSVAQRAARIADRALGSNRFTASDFAGPGGSLTIIPPTAATPGAYGASIIGISFAGPSVSIAQVGLNAVLQAYGEAVSATARAQSAATVADIDRAINRINRQLASLNQQLAAGATSVNPGGPSQNDLRSKRQLLLNQRGSLLTQRARALVTEQTPLIQQPTISAESAGQASGSKVRVAAIGFIIGLILSGALAYARASRRRGIADRQDPAELYGVPLLGEIPAFAAGKTWRSNGASGKGLPMTGDPHSAAAEAFRFAAGSVERVRGSRGLPLSLVFISPFANSGKSTVVANLALAIAEGGTRVLVVDGDAAGGELTARLLPGTPTVDGFEQLLAGGGALADYVQPSPLNSAVAILGSGPLGPSRVTGAARSNAVRALLAEAKASFDVVLIDTPAFLQVADATELAEASDAAIIVLSPNELIRDHLEMVERLKLIGSQVVGYIYDRAPTRHHLAPYRRNGSPAPPMDHHPAVVPSPPAISDGLRRRDDVALALGGPVRLSVGTVPLNRWQPGKHGLAAAPTDIRQIVAYLGGAVPTRSRGAATLAIVPVDDLQVAAVSLVSLAVSCAQQGQQVVVADLARGAPAAGLLRAEKTGVYSVRMDDTHLVVAVPERDEAAPIGPLDRASEQAQRSPFTDAVIGACASADLVLTLVPLDPSFCGEHLRTWATDAVVVVTAGRSSWTKIHAVGEMIRLVGTRLVSAVLIGADKTDQSLGVTSARGADREAEIMEGGVHSDEAGFFVTAEKDIERPVPGDE
jgi:Mrp family chromosome partitioning ATPase